MEQIMIKQAKQLNLYNLQNELKATLNVLKVEGNTLLVENVETLKKASIVVLNSKNNRSWDSKYKFIVEVKE